MFRTMKYFSFVYDFSWFLVNTKKVRFRIFKFAVLDLFDEKSISICISLKESIISIYSVWKKS